MTLDEEIARKLREAAASGELAAAEGYGRPFDEDEGWHATPEALRMPFKILKNAGYAPPEVELFHERARLRAAVELATDADERQRLQQALSALEQSLALRLESLRVNASL
ncbi:DnaJ family domain-containing protein [Roseateles cavernae]|uniref:DnaJ family domain-containing protein n=1 Tax=Roseateles cavernae TaxID=3153578 RepID=UPI0032E417E6